MSSILALFFFVLIVSFILLFGIGVSIYDSINRDSNLTFVKIQNYPEI